MGYNLSCHVSHDRLQIQNNVVEKLENVHVKTEHIAKGEKYWR